MAIDGPGLCLVAIQHSLTAGLWLDKIFRVGEMQFLKKLGEVKLMYIPSFMKYIHLVHVPLSSMQRGKRKYNNDRACPCVN